MSAQPEKHSPVPRSQGVVQRRVELVDDEINLIDLWLVLVRRKWLIAVITALVVVGGLIYAFIVPPSFVYTTTIEIGTQIVNHQVAPIEGQDSVRAKIAESYIPLVIQQYQSKVGNKGGSYNITVNAPANSQVVVLNSKGPLKDEAVYKRLQSLVVERLKEDHKRVSNVLRKGIEAQMAEGQRKISALGEEKRLLNAQLKRTDDERVLLTSAIEHASSLVADSEKQRAEAVNEVTDPTRAMTLLLLSEQLRKARERLTDLKERLTTELPDKRDKIEKALSDNRFAQENQQTDIEKLHLSLVSMLETRAVSPPLRLPDPVGPGKAMMLLLSFVSGLVLALFSAFFIEFLSKVKGRNA